MHGRARSDYLHTEGGAHAFTVPRGSGARGVVAAEALVHAVQQVLGQAVPRAGQHLLEANDSLQAQPATHTGLLSAGGGCTGSLGLAAGPEGLRESSVLSPGRVGWGWKCSPAF